MILRPEMQQLYIASAQVLLPPMNAPWWLASGTISASNVEEHVELPSQGQLYAGGAIANGQPWSVVARGNSCSTTTSDGTSDYIFDSESGRVVLGISSAALYGFFATAWAQRSLYPDGNVYTWFLISDGSNVQAYLDNSAVGASQASGTGLANSGSTRWRTDYVGTGAIWDQAVAKAAVYNIALDSTQRAALYTAMAS